MADDYYEAPVSYFTKPGPRNTDLVLAKVRTRSEELEIDKILVPSCSGKTARSAVERLASNCHLIIVTHVTGFSKPNEQEMPEAIRTDLINSGAHVLTAQHAFGGGRARAT